MRIPLSRLTALGGAVAIVVALGSTPAVAGPPPIVARSIFVVRPDPRLCPSPQCGGYWVAIANRPRTKCHDGLFRPRCYVAIALDVGTREPVQANLSAGALVRGVIGSRKFDGIGELGAISVAETWKPFGRTSATDDFFRLRDTGVRCVRAPCFSLRAARLNTLSKIAVSGLAVRPAKPTAEQLALAEAALTTSGGLLAAGRIVATADGGRLFRASRIFLRVAPPRG
jgi:hypothetical protein